MATNGVNGVKKPGSVLDHSGYLFNEYSKSKEHMVLRAGVLRIRSAPKGSDLAVLYIFAVGTEVTLLANCKLKITCRVPHAQEYLFTASSESDAEVWHDRLQASIKSAEKKTKGLLEHIYNGSTMHKYNYSNSKRSRRFFWVQKDELCWGRAKSDAEVQNVNLKECLGIVYGPMTTTFQRCESREDPDWACFSLLFTGRTLDLAVAGDLQIHAWLLGLQHLISQHGLGSMPIMSEGEFYRRKVQYKLMSVAHENGYILSRFLIMKVKEAASGGGKPSAELKGGGLGAGALVSGGPLAKPMQVFSPKKEKKDKRKDKEVIDPETALKLDGLKNKVLELHGLLRRKSAEADGQEELLKRAKEGSIGGKSASEELSSELQKITLDVLSKRCKALEAQAQQLTESNEQMAPQAKDAGKSERSLKKLQAKLEEYDSRKRALEQELGIASATAAKESGALTASSAAKEVAQSRGQELQRRVRELEEQLKNPQQGQAHKAAVENKQHDEAIAKAEQEKLHLKQRLEALEQEQKSTLETEKKLLERLSKSQKANQSLDARVAPLKVQAKDMRDQQQRLRTEVKDIGSHFNEEVQKLLDATSKMGERTKALELKYKLAMEDRKKLHNLVLDLKGNIRVFVRVRPINSKEKPHEPEGEPTINFKDDTNIGVYDGQHSRRKFFEFDQVFPPTTSQIQVFEEAKPLATSTLDGYNVCIFAYGQTGSGKTHTMTGTNEDPGLNTRVLRELFRIRDERKNEYDIQISISITEIYNESIRDLLNPEGKEKLDVRINQDGTCGVPGLTETPVNNVDDVLKCIGDASKNRATSTTDMNEQSSRSHSIVTVRTKCTLKGSDTYIGKIHLIDLAGSENTNKSGVMGQGMKEAQNINKSLSALGDVIQSLVGKSSHTPYRNSKLTMMLKDSLGGDSKTLMIVCVSPAQFNVTESLSALNFASRARNVELGKAKRNVASN